MLPLKVGLVGTGYAAKLRAETLRADDRAQLVAVSGHTPETTAEFCQTYGAESVSDSRGSESAWKKLIDRDDIDLIIIANVNRDHGTIAKAALQAGKHVVVEYPLSLDVAEAEAIIQLAQQQGKLLHIEHIELLSGIHEAIVNSLGAVGTPFYVRYSNINPQRPAPQKWTYQPELFGFPLMGAVSRIHRLTNLFGDVNTVSCQERYWSESGLPSPYTACLCTAQLRFKSGLVSEVIYAKGDAFWKAERSLDIHGDKGAILIDGDQGMLVQEGEAYPLEMGTRRGLFAKDTKMVLDHLLTGTPLYVTPEASLYALKVADAARRSAESGKTVQV